MTRRRILDNHTRFWYGCQMRFVLLPLLLLSASAAAEPVDLRGEANLAGALWAFAGDCTGDAWEVRQCEWYQQERSAAYRKPTWLVDGDEGALTWQIVAAKGKNKRTKATTKAKTTGKLAPVAPPRFELSYAVNVSLAPTIASHGKASVRWNAYGHRLAQRKGKLLASRAFASKGQAEAWMARMKKRVQLHYAFSLSKQRALQKSKDGKVTLNVDVHSYRLYDPCSGDYLLSELSTRVSLGEPVRNKQSCEKADGEKTVTIALKEAKDPLANLPESLSPDQIQATLKPLRVQAEGCYYQYGVPGKANVKLLIAGDGSVAKATQTGDFTGTPTGQCINAAIKKLKFPPSKQKETEVNYPLKLQ